MNDHGQVPDDSDELVRLLALMAAGAPDPSGGARLNAAVHAAIFPMCLHLLGDPHDAQDAEQETFRRLWQYHHGRGADAPVVIHGVAYVRQIARNVCKDLGRGLTEDRQRRADLADLHDLPAATPDPAVADMTPPVLHLLRNRDLVEKFGYRSRQLLEDVSGLTRPQLEVLRLHLTGLPYREIALALGGTSNPDAVQANGERAMQHLRGRVHARVWVQEPLSVWTVHPCPTLAPLKAELRATLQAGDTAPARLYQAVGKHLDPHPNRAAGRGDPPRCGVCDPERRRYEAVYIGLLGTIPPVVAVISMTWPSTPAIRPTAAQQPLTDPKPGSARGQVPMPVPVPPHGQVPPPAQVPPYGQVPVHGGAGSGRRRSGRVLVSVLVALALLLLTTGVVVAVQVVRGDQSEALSGSRSPAPPTGRTPPSTTGATPAAETVPEVCDLVTAGEVTAALGGDAFLECNAGPTPAAGTPRTDTRGNFERSTVESHGVREFAGFALGRSDPKPSGSTLPDCGPGSRTAAGLGDANCYTFDPLSGASVNVQRGHLYLKAVFGLVNGSIDAVLDLVRLMVGRLPGN